MFPEKNLDAFSAENFKGLDGMPILGGSKFGFEWNVGYANFIQSKINTNLILLSNPRLIQQFDKNYNDVVSETQKLMQISDNIVIPNLKEERRRK